VRGLQAVLRRVATNFLYHGGYRKLRDPCFCRIERVRSLKGDFSLQFFGPLEVTSRHKGQLQRLLAIRT